MNHIILYEVKLGEPKFGKSGNKLGVNEARLIHVMCPGQYYSKREISKLLNIDLGSVTEAMKRLSMRGAVKTYLCEGASNRNCQHYLVYVFNGFLPSIFRNPSSEDLLKRQRRIPSSSSSSESDSESEEEESLVKNLFRKSSEEGEILCQ